MITPIVPSSGVLLFTIATRAPINIPRASDLSPRLDPRERERVRDRRLRRECRLPRPRCERRRDRVRRRCLVRLRLRERLRERLRDRERERRRMLTLRRGERVRDLRVNTARRDDSLRL